MRLRGVEPPRGCSPHKALNLARLPVPPQARDATILEQPRPPCIRPAQGLLCEHVFPNERHGRDREGKHMSVDLTKRQRRSSTTSGAICASTVSTDRARDRQRARPALAVDRPRPPREAGADRDAAPRSDQAEGDRADGRQGAGPRGGDPGGRKRRRGRADAFEENIEDYYEVPSVIGGRATTTSSRFAATA